MIKVVKKYLSFFFRQHLQEHLDLTLSASKSYLVIPFSVFDKSGLKILFFCFFFRQHLQEHLDLTLSAVEWMMKEYPEIKERDVMRRNIGKYGLTGQQQVLLFNDFI